MTALVATLEKHPLVTGGLGSLAALSGSAVAFLQDLKLIFGVTAGGLGVVAGILTVLIHLRNLRQGNKRSE